MDRYRVICWSRGDTIVEASGFEDALARFRARPDAEGATIRGIQLGEDVSTFKLVDEDPA
jgi:hypothetical protein